MKDVMTLLDGFTQFLFAIPIPDLESTTLLNCFIERFCLKVWIARGGPLSKQFQDSL